ncbi:hypothetical protein HJC23_008980 [Cyclotella cryptica]|uniref:Uncharacterized protein n=1 Tax=Cyclotella cryptica TaxID=29204 RepID=A0ABD3QS00_9STRA
MTPRKRNSRNEWIHGGKYVKPSTPRLAQNDDRYHKDDDDASRHELTGHIVSPRSQLRTRAQQLIHWTYPVLEFSIRTLIAFIVTLIGALVVGIAILKRWKREQSTSASVDRPASEGAARRARTLQERADERSSISPVEYGVTPPPLSVESNSFAQRTTTATTSREQPPPKSAPPASAMRSRNVATTTPRSARRVLFSETEQGEVSTTKIHYDKDLPASARKVKNNYEHVTIDHGISDLRSESNVSHNNISTATAASTLHSSPRNAGKTTFTPTNNNPIAKVNELPWKNPTDRTLQNFPSIKRESTHDSRFNPGAKLSPNHNPKRKRLELIGATSRWNRNRRVRVMSNHIFHTHHSSTMLLGKSNTLKRRRDQREIDQIDQFVWHAMNDASGKENFNGAECKRAKGSSSEGAESIVRPVMTPWKGGRL